MATSVYEHIARLWKKPKQNPLWRVRLIKWRKENSVEKIEKPTRLDRARALGYKAKKGFVIARARLKRGGKLREKFPVGRESKSYRRNKTINMNLQWIAEQRAQKKFSNLEVLNSYWVGEDGKYKWYEIILVDPQMPEIKNDSRFEWVCNPANRKRVFRGLTSAGKKARGLR
ncbi:50S ribosomal protein L15e [archaeon]|nr:50S ribosomal protein L15e [archaeon]